MGNTHIKNDDKILQLKQKIEEKKKQLGDGRFSPITNCNLVWMETRYNLHSLNDDKLKFLLVELRIRENVVEEFDFDYEVSGYNLSDWIEDIKSRLVILNRVEEERKLKLMETKLDKLLSNEKKVELELKEIEDLL